MRLFRCALLASALLAAAASGAAEDSAETAAGSGLSLATSPSGASVYLNGFFVAYTPFDEADLPPGLYRMTVRAPGYYDRDLTVTLSSRQRLKLGLDLVKITGFLRLTVFPADALVAIDGETAAPGTLELSEGFHTLSVRAFGYEEKTVSAFVDRFVPVDLAVNLGKAPLSLTELTASRPVFNPGNPSTLGATIIAFSVSKASRGEATIRGPLGAVILSRDLGAFAKWGQSFSWDGKNEGGQPVPDGAYVVRVGASDGMSSVSAEINLRVDSAAYIGPLDITSGLVGLRFSPAVAPQPQGTTSVSISALSPLPVSVPFTAHLAFSTVPVAGLALGFGLGLPVGITGGAARFLAGLSYATGIGKSPLSLGAAASASLSSGKETDGNLAFLATVGLKSRPLAAVVAPGLEIDSSGGKTLFSAALRCAVYVETGGFLAGLSGASRSTPFGSAFGIGFPVQAAAETSWLIPGTSFAPGIVLEASWNDSTAPPVFGGGLSFLVLF